MIPTRSHRPPVCLNLTGRPASSRVEETPHFATHFRATVIRRAVLISEFSGYTMAKKTYSAQSIDGIRPQSTQPSDLVSVFGMHGSEKTLVCPVFMLMLMLPRAEELLIVTLGAVRSNQSPGVPGLHNQRCLFTHISSMSSDNCRPECNFNDFVPHLPT